MRLQTLMLLAFAPPLLAQSPDPTPNAPVIACQIVMGLQDVVTLRQTAFRGSGPLQVLACNSNILVLPWIGANVTGGVVSFTCYSLQQLALTCPPPFMIPSAVLPGTMIYAGLTFGGVLHLAAMPSGTLDCMGSMACMQDIFPSPAPGEYPIMRITVGSGIQNIWTGYPALPQVIAPDNCQVSQTPIQVVVTCQ